jgi:hypothetical protein
VKTKTKVGLNEVTTTFIYPDKTTKQVIIRLPKTSAPMEEDYADPTD